MKTIKDCHYLYSKCDVLLLADVFEKFRNNSLKNYGLFPIHYLSALALSRDAMFKMTKVELELTANLDMYIFFEKCIRGGVSQVSNRYSKTNKKYLKYYGTKPESQHIIYLDANNIYGSVMSMFLPKQVD